MVGAKDCTIHRGGNVTHNLTGMKVGTIKAADGGGFMATHADGTKVGKSPSGQGALFNLVSHHNGKQVGKSKAKEYGQVSAEALELAVAAMPASTPAVSSGDGPRHVLAGLGPVGQRAYSKLRSKKMPHPKALMMAKRAQALSARRSK